MRRLPLDHYEIERAVRVERRVRGGDQALDGLSFAGGHRRQFVVGEASTERGLMIKTMTMEIAATTAKAPKITLSGTP